MYRPANRIYPRLAYADEAAAADWLAKAFGFAEKHRKVNDDGSALIWLELDGSALMVCRSGLGLSAPGELSGVTEKTICYVDDVTAHHATAVAAGAEIDRELQDTPWGDRRYEAVDPEGHRWHFAELVGEG